MSRSIVPGLAFSVLALGMSSGASPAELTQAQLAKLAQDAKTDVIVIMRDQMPAIPPARGAPGARSAALSISHGAIIAELQRAGVTKIHEFNTINAIATTLSRSEIATLAADPQVQAIVQDVAIPAKMRPREPLGSTARASAPASAPGLCNTLEPQALQLTHTAFLDENIPQAQRVRDANGDFVTGKGVKVAAIFADGLDPTIPGFTRPDGSPVFIDYQDFSGDPSGTPMYGSEAFLDAGSIAAQDNPNGRLLTFDISQYATGSSYPLPSPCNVRIRGMAPGASLIGIQLSTEAGFNSTTSDWIRGIEYAVATGADVIDETFALFLIPDTDRDAVSLANAAAVAAGVTVVISAGDAGPASTISGVGPEVIAVGASTSYRVYAQLQFDAFPLSSGGYLNDNVSPFSSGGFSQTGARTVDVVAPGDLGWSLCGEDSTLFVGCASAFSGNGSPIEFAGGTSESAPFTAGEAALVIQAYRSAHHGADPTPAVVKQLIMSSATDLGAPAYEQGAGLINSLAAVNAALSIQDGGPQLQGRGHGLLYSPTSAAITDLPSTNQMRHFVITNTGSARRHVEPRLEVLGAPFSGANVTVQLRPASDPTYLSTFGNYDPYVEQKFQVPAGAQHLDAAIAWQTPTSGATPVVILYLLDPLGQFAADSTPQGPASGYGHVDVVHPMAGTWTAIMATPRVQVTYSYTGPVKFSWGVERDTSFGEVSPSSLDLAPGESGTVAVQFQMPSQPGDSAAAIRFARPESSDDVDSSEIPLVMRTLIAIGESGGAFSGTLTGGNGRTDGAPTQTFAFDVPAGIHDMMLALELSDSGYLLEGLLVDPQGMPLSVQGNLDPSGNPQAALQLSRFNPQPGRWRFLLVQNLISSGNQTSEPFRARVDFNTAQVSAAGLPDNPNISLSASASPVTIPISVTNTGPVAQAYFADARLDRQVEKKLLPDYECTAGTLPAACMQFALPTEVSDIRFFAHSPAPIDMIALSYQGSGLGGTASPYIGAKKVSAHMVMASLGTPEVPYGIWDIFPSNIGPYGADGAPMVQVHMGAIAIMQPFDRTVSADSGDIWVDLTSFSNTYNPLMLAPGQTGIINVTFTPDPKEIGKAVSGFLYIDTFNFYDITGDEVVRLPYHYSVSQ